MSNGPKNLVFRRKLLMTDQQVIDLSSSIAYKLRQELTFPGQVKVTVIRESKFVDFAK
jgi:ribonuclease Y